MNGLPLERSRGGGWEHKGDFGGVFHERTVRRESFSSSVYSNCAPEEGYFVQRER
jgi:hypothetical protein